MKKTSIASLAFSFFLLFYFTSPSLSPLNGGMFGFQDPTQVGRVTSFANNLKTFHIPPRLAPEYSFYLGFPVFNFYAPTAYWITSLIVLFGISSITAVKLSFLLALFTAFFGMYYFLTKLFGSSKNSSAAWLGACVYVSSTYFATEIVVRGNLAESWFLGLLPLALGLIIHNSQTKNRYVQVAITIVLALLFTSHNMMMLFAIPIVLIFVCFFPEKRKNLFAAGTALLIDSYFFIPAFLESSLVQAAIIAKEYNYQDHFLCAWQLWTAKGWVFGGSLPGCDSGVEMSLKIGKIQVLLGVLGLVFLMYQIVKKKQVLKKQQPLLLIAVISLGALFLTWYPSEFIWNTFAPVMSVFQFPWRFIAFGIFGVAVFAGYLLTLERFPAKKIIVGLLCVMLFVPARKYFITPIIPFETYQQQYNSDEYLSEHLAYKIPEYLVTGADLTYWRSLESTSEKKVELPFDPHQPVQSTTKYQIIENTPYDKSLSFIQADEVTLNIHYFPFWQIFVNDTQIIPQKFDQLARPILEIQANDTVEIHYIQTSIQKAANLLTLFGFILFIYSVCATKHSFIRLNPSHLTTPKNKA